jgi:SAM-dependent methyltransferase
MEFVAARADELLLTMLRSNLEYIPMRLLRKFMLNDGLLLRFGRWLPYYRANRNQADPSSIVDEYVNLLAIAGFAPQGKRILEVGVGRTNSTGYEIAARLTPKSTVVYEPYVSFGASEDASLLLHIASKYQVDANFLVNHVSRLSRLDRVPSGSIDLILSSSVLEHVNDPPSLFADLKRLLSPNGAMLHQVDYRDHFFKYPYHFLQFKKETWNRWLNPGNLPGWRLYDHIEQLEAQGFDVRVLWETRDEASFTLLANRVAHDYRRTDYRVQATGAALWVVAGRS